MHQLGCQQMPNRILGSDSALKDFPNNRKARKTYDVSIEHASDMFTRMISQFQDTLYDTPV
jgi:hypothetical protein